MEVGDQHHAPAALPPGKIRGTVGPRAALDGCGKSRPHRDSISRPSSAYRVAIPTAPFRGIHSYTRGNEYFVSSKVTF